MYHKYARTFVLALTIPVLFCASSPIARMQSKRFALLRNKASAHHRLNQLEQAFVDAADVLEGDNPCAGFYGESRVSVSVLNSLAEQIQLESMPDSRLGVTMRGSVTNHVDAQNGAAYRLFQHTNINLNGPFYRNKSFAADRGIPYVGSFLPNTRKARVLMLLHELAHLIAGPDGRWLIPDDGNNQELSRKNTLLVEARCRDQIKEIRAGR